MWEETLKEAGRMESEDPNAALEVYQKILSESEGEVFGEAAYRCALFLHRFKEEEMALDLFASCFQTGMHKEEIRKLCVRDFWEPFQEKAREQYVLQTGLLKERFPLLKIPEFGELPYYAFPVSGEQYLLFDGEEDCFLDWLYTGEEVLMSVDAKEPRPFSPIIMDSERKKKQEMLSYLYQNGERRMYIIETEKHEWTGLLLLPDLLFRCMENVVLFQGAEEAKRYFYETGQSLPRISKIGNRDLEKEITDFIEKEHERRIQEKGVGRSPFLTIGIPSWNRGKRALSLVEELRTLPLDVELEILVSNNGSDVYVEEYHRIRDMADSRIAYYEFPENRMFHGNVAQVLRKARGEWVLLLSDEDMLDFDLLPSYLERLETYRKKVAVVRPGSRKVYAALKGKYARKGKDAVYAFNMCDNYMSGVTYNRKFMTAELVNRVEGAFQENYAYRVYTHMIFDWYMCLAGDFYNCPLHVVIEGESADAGKNKNASYAYNSFENRIRQHYGYIDILNRMEDVEDSLKLHFFMTVSGKLVYLIYMRRAFYQTEEESWEERCERIREVLYDGYERLQLNVGFKKIMRSEVEEKLNNAWKEHLLNGKG